uniref:Uncharacterized protein n=1 Tax=Ciona intestinalis TaxID=7719 RepID=H2XUZ1_CIOIN
MAILRNICKNVFFIDELGIYKDIFTILIGQEPKLCYFIAKIRINQ